MLQGSEGSDGKTNKQRNVVQGDKDSHHKLESKKSHGFFFFFSSNVLSSLDGEKTYSWIETEMEV